MVVLHRHMLLGKHWQEAASELKEDAGAVPVHQPKLVPPCAMYRLMEPEPSLYFSTWLK